MCNGFWKPIQAHNYPVRLVHHYVQTCESFANGRIKYADIFRHTTFFKDAKLAGEKNSFEVKFAIATPEESNVAYYKPKPILQQNLIVTGIQRHEELTRCFSAVAELLLALSCRINSTHVAAYRVKYYTGLSIAL